MIAIGQRMERTAAWALGVYGIVLPIEGLGGWTPRSGMGMQLCDLVVVVASPMLLVLLWRRRSAIAREPIVRASAFLAAAAIGSSIVRGAGDPALTVAAKQAVFVLTVGCFAALGAGAHAARVLGGVCAGGIAAVAVSIVGYTWGIALADGTVTDFPFILRTTHPVFDGFPRLSGTFGNSPQEMGEATVVFLAALWTARRLRRRKILGVGLLLATVALLLTFSSAWVAGVVVAAGFATATWPKRPAVFALAVAAVVLGVALTFVSMNFGIPGRPERSMARGPFPCGEGETEHFVTWALDARSSSCRQVQMSWPYPGILTTYWLAKKTAWRAISNAPLLGHGRHGYRAYATETFRTLSGGRVLGVFYDRPHCTPLEVVAAFGVPGGIALLFLVAAVLSSRPKEPTALSMPLWLATVGLLLVGLNIDILERRPFWALLGLLAATSSAARSPGSKDLPEVLDGAPDAVVERHPRLPAQ